MNINIEITVTNDIDIDEQNMSVMRRNLRRDPEATVNAVHSGCLPLSALKAVEDYY